MGPLGPIFLANAHNNTRYRMSFNLCNLPPAEKALIEVDKAAAYAVWKERNGKLATAELDSSAFKDHELEVFTKALAKYRARP